MLFIPASGHLHGVVAGPKRLAAEFPEQGSGLRVPKYEAAVKRPTHDKLWINFHKTRYS